MENIDYWNIMDVDGMISNNSRPEIDPEWIKNLSKDDRIFCKCLNDKYYYDASIKKIVGSEENRKFLVTFAGLTARHDQTFNFVQACDSFLYMNWNTAKFVKAFNAHCLEVIRNTMKETGANFDEKYDAAGSAFLRDFDKIDHAMITKNVRIRYPPRYSIAELINAFTKERAAFLHIFPYTAQNFCDAFQAKISENNFHNELFYNDSEIHKAVEECERIKNQRSNNRIQLAYSFGVVHLLRYLYHLFQFLQGRIESEENQKIFYLVHELAQFIGVASNNYYNNRDDYIYG